MINIYNIIYCKGLIIVQLQNCLCLFINLIKFIAFTVAPENIVGFHIIYIVMNFETVSLIA